MIAPKALRKDSSKQSEMYLKNTNILHEWPLLPAQNVEKGLRFATEHVCIQHTKK